MPFLVKSFDFDTKVKGDGNEEMRGKFGRILGDFL